MSLAETRLTLAGRVAERTDVGGPTAGADDPVAARLRAFEAAHGALTALEAGPDDWTEAVLRAAWALVDDALPDGAALEGLLDALARAFATIAAAASPADPTQPRRPRRDA